jgi:hypothetical protein
MRLLGWNDILDGFARWESNTPLWQIVDGPVDATDEGAAGTADAQQDRRCIALLGNTAEDHEHGKALLFGDPDWSDYALNAEVRVVRGYLSNPRQTYPGIALRARDVYNYEHFFFRPHNTTGHGAAYVPVAHGLQPVWTEAYHAQEFGRCAIPFDTWFRVRAEVRGREAVLYVDGREAMRRTLTYYLWRGRPGLHVGTCTDALYRNVTVEAL